MILIIYIYIYILMVRYLVMGIFTGGRDRDVTLGQWGQPRVRMGQGLGSGGGLIGA